MSAIMATDMYYESEEEQLIQFYNNKEFITEEIKINSNKLSFVNKRGKSEVWNRFVRVFYDNNKTEFVKCIHCNAIQRQVVSSGTSGLLKHKCKQWIECLENNTINGLDNGCDEDSNEFSPLNDKQFLSDLVKSGDKSVSFRKQRGKSEVWNRFERILYNNCETKYVCCMHCNDVHKHPNGVYGTAGLVRHNCCGVVDMNESRRDNSTHISVVDSESEPLIDRNYLIELIHNNDQRLCFVPETGKSEAWLRFERIYLDDTETLYVKCKSCDCVQKHTSIVGTRGLLRHRCRNSSVDEQSVMNFATETELMDKRNDFKTESIDEKDVNVKQMIDENKTLKLIVEKCLKVIDSCLCVNKYSSKERKEINVLINNYNKFQQNCQQMSQSDGNIETNDVLDAEKGESIRELNSRSDIELDESLEKSDVKKICPNPMNKLEFYGNKFANRHRITKAIKKKYTFKKPKIICQFELSEGRVCGKACRNKQFLKKHRDSVHLQIKNYVCAWPGCEERFFQSHQMKAHTIKCHTNEKPFKCDVCSFETIYKDHLIKHKRIHSDVKHIMCDWPGCDFRTHHERALRDHKLRHSGEKPFHCSWPSCEWSFRQSHHLKAHMLKHTGERPVMCEILGCDRRFTSRQAMRFHIQKVHNNDLKV